MALIGLAISLQNPMDVCTNRPCVVYSRFFFAFVVAGAFTSPPLIFLISFALATLDAALHVS